MLSMLLLRRRSTQSLHHCLHRECTRQTTNAISASFHTQGNVLLKQKKKKQQQQKKKKTAGMQEKRKKHENIHDPSLVSRDYEDPSVHYASEMKKIELPDEFHVDEFLQEEDEHRRARDLSELYSFRPTPSVDHAKKSKYMINPYKFDRRLQPVWDFNKLNAFNEARYPAIEADPIIPPKKKSDALDEYKVKDVEDVKNKFEFRAGVTSEELLEAGISPDEDKEVVAKIFGWQNASPAELHKKNIEIAIARFQEKPGDTGSSAVQIAILTEKIHYMTDHLRKHHKDKGTQRKVQIFVNRRKKLMEYLKRKDGEKYWKCVKALDLRVF